MSGNKSLGPIQTPVSVTKRDRKNTKRKKRDHCFPLSGNEIGAAGCLRLLPEHGRFESVKASQLVAANKLLRSDKMFAGLMGLECHTKPLPHRCEGKHGSLCSLFWLTCEDIIFSAWKHRRVSWFTSICSSLYASRSGLFFGIWCLEGKNEMQLLKVHRANQLCLHCKAGSLSLSVCVRVLLFSIRPLTKEESNPSCK